MKIKADDILIRFIETPNPLAIKVVANFPFKQEGKATFKTFEQCAGMPLFASLFSLENLLQIYVTENQMTLTFKARFQEDLEFVKSIIKSRGVVHNPDFKTEEESTKKKNRDDLPEHMKQVEEILDRTIRPGLQADGGDIELVSFKDNKIEIAYQGACGGCPSSYMGTLEAIENILQQELDNEDIEVEPIQP